MGCGSCRVIIEETSDSPIDYNLDKIPLVDSLKFTEIEYFNSHYEKAILILQMIEEMRINLIDNLDYLILETGASVFLNPDIANCIKCVLWKLSQNFEGDLMKSIETEIKFLDQEPFIKILNTQKLLKDDTYIFLNLLITYISDLFQLKWQIKKIETKIPHLIYLLSENNGKYFLGRQNNSSEESVNIFNNSTNSNINKNSDYNKIHVIKIITKNNNKIKKALDLFPNLIKDYNISIEKVKFEFILLKKKSDYLFSINRIGREAFQKNINEINQISFLSKDIINDKSEEEVVEVEEKHNKFNIYHKSIQEGKNKYKEIILSKKIFKDKKINKQNII